MALSDSQTKDLADPRRVESRGKYDGLDLPAPVPSDSLALLEALDGCADNCLHPSTRSVKDEGA